MVFSYKTETELIEDPEQEGILGDDEVGELFNLDNETL